MKKRFTSLLLAALLIIGIIPFTAVFTAAEEPKYKTVLNDTMAQLAITVSEPAFGTSGGEWSVLSLARGGYFNVGDPYFESYYSNIEKTVPGLAETAAGKGVKEGGLDKNKSTENSRLILALAAIGKDPSDVGGVNVLGAYDANGFTWIKKQGINGPIFTLIALDTKGFPTEDTTLRQQCVDFILSKKLAGGGWALSGTAADPDITSMALQALVKYKDQKEVATAAEEAFTVLSNMQKDNGGFASWGSVNSESIAQVITACSAWGIDADKDARFVKSDGSALDALLTFYVPEGKGFAHVLTSGGGYTGGEVNGMATDQACYALVAYDRFVNGKTSLYDMTDVIELDHEFTYSADGSVIKATCSHQTCVYSKSPLTLTLQSASDTIYSGKAIEAVLNSNEASTWEATFGSLPTICYKALEGSKLTEGKPVEIGSYEASISMEDATATVKFEITEPTAYKIIEGANSTWDETSEKPLTFRSDADFSKFVKVLLDGEILDPSNYTASSGSTIITLKPEFASTLKSGKHTIEIVSTDGSALANFYIEEAIANTDGGVTSEATLPMSFIAFTVIGLSTVFFVGKKKKLVF